LTSYLGICFWNIGLAIVLLNNHNGLKAQEFLELLNFGLKIKFPMKIKFHFFNCEFIIQFNLIYKYTKLNDQKPNLLHMRGTNYIQM